MKLAEILPSDNVVVPLKGATLAEAATALIDHSMLAGAVVDAEKIRLRLAEWRTEDLVVLADRAFIMHLRSDAVQEIVLLVGVTPEPLCRELSETETQCARIIVLLLAPARRAAEYLQLLGALSRLFAREPVIEDALAHADPDGLPVFLRGLDFDLPKQLRVRDFMIPRPRTTAPDTTLRDAAREMVRSGIGSLVVLDADSRVMGMLGEKELMRDLLTNYLQGGTANRDTPTSTGRRRVRDVMTRQVLGVAPDQPLAEIASIMVNKDVERVPVIEDGSLVGVLTRADIVRKLIGY